MLITKKLTKNKKERQKIKIASQLAAEVLQLLDDFIRPGITTEEIDSFCHNHIVKNQRAIPACLGYKGFPKSVCTSVNNIACHGIPNDQEVLKDGDVINVDVTVIKDGYHGDTSKMYYVGEVSKEAQHVCEASYTAMMKGIEAIRPGEDIGVIGTAIEQYVNTTPYSVCREYSGHGIGKNFHEFPSILSFQHEYGILLEPGMTFTVEPIVNEGTDQTEERDGCNWTIYTVDNKISAQHEHTVLVTKQGYEILSLREEEK